MANDATNYEASPQSLYDELSTSTFDPATAYDDPNAAPVVPQGWTTGGPVDGGLPTGPEAAEAPVLDAVQPDAPVVPIEAESQPEPAPAPAKEAQAETVINEEDLGKLKQRLRSEAERDVINNHRDEYVAIASAKFAAHGLEFTRRLTEAERAEKQIRELLEKNPELAEKFSK